MGHIKPRFLPTQKEEREPFHFVAQHSDPVLKRVARGTLEMIAIKFSGLSRESVSSGPSIHGWEKTEGRAPCCQEEGEGEGEWVCACVCVCVCECLQHSCLKKKYKYYPFIFLPIHVQTGLLTCRNPANIHK